MIDNNLKIFTEEFEKLKGQFVLCNNRAERLIGLFSDDWDYYWVLSTDEGLRLVSGLFRITQLKDKIKRISTDFLDDEDILIEYKNTVETLGNKVRYIPYLFSISNGQNDTTSLVHLPRKS